MTGTIDRASLINLINELSKWDRQARPSQRVPAGDWLKWVICTGRGWGKTRTAGETILKWAKEKTAERFHLVARTAADARDTMVEGESGIMRIAPHDFRPSYEPSKRRLTFPNGAVAILFSAEEPDALRGPQCGAWWADEVASWKYLQGTWDNLQFGARLGKRVRGIVTTTPRPIKFMRELVVDPECYVTHGSLIENKANLAPSFIKQIFDTYDGTRLGLQEIEGKILSDNPGALWKRSNIDADRVAVAPAMQRIVVAIDPSCTDTGDEAGIIVAGLGVDDQYYLLEDCTIQASPDVWARRATGAYHRHKADIVVYETNQGGQMVTLTLKTVDPFVPTRGIHANRGKLVRAEPIAALCEQHRVHHVGNYVALEDELCNYDGTGTASPNRLDAYVYAFSELHRRIAKPVKVH